MLIVADSGGTKTDWRFLQKNGEVKMYASLGLNPYIANQAAYDQAINCGFSAEEKLNVISVYFYTAGCNSIAIKKLTTSYLKTHFPQASITVKSDLEGAGTALYGENNGFIGLLGTGSGWAKYENGQIIRNISGLGYILGDEGSGADLGKTLLVDLLRNNLPVHLINKLVSNHDKKEIILKNLYASPNPACYLASFAKIIHDNLDDPYMYELVYKCFKKYVSIITNLYPEINMSSIGFVGTIAFQFQGVLIPVLASSRIKMPKIIKSPIEELIKYHRNEERFYKYN